jgi:hypothetical protein
MLISITQQTCLVAKVLQAPCIHAHIPVSERVQIRSNILEALSIHHVFCTTRKMVRLATRANQYSTSDECQGASRTLSNGPERGEGGSHRRQASGYRGMYHFQHAYMNICSPPYNRVTKLV